MQAKLTSDFFAGNRQTLRELFTGTAPIVMTANGLLQRGGDSTFKFAQDASFWYLTGIDEPDIVLVMDRDREYLIVPKRSSVRAAFDGEVETSQLETVSGIKLVFDDTEGWSQLEARLKKVKHVATLSAAPAYVEQYGMYTNPARASLMARLQATNPQVEILDLATHLARMRMIKQPAEIAAIQEAVDVTTASMKSVLKATKLPTYKYEYEIEAELTKAYRQAGTGGHSFEPIVASGQRACTLHNVANNGKLGSGELMVVDTGAEVSHYAADISRTLVLGKASRRQQAVYSAVLEVQEFAAGLLRPGVLLRDYEHQVEHFMGEKLRALGLIKTINHDNVRRFYPHATSHFLGLNVHDVGDYDRPLEPGVVLTVEPGIYIPAEGIGVRIEDDILITAKGTKVLSSKLARDLTKL
ncbi:MAG TPA: Xaa-Pro aminopeptidase [Candidatus Saccharimonadales bacterium]|nr:Xaa-Pro aminopeptidase [Candidatus Saccharimonadales bacterium]